MSAVLDAFAKVNRREIRQRQVQLEQAIKTGDAAQARRSEKSVATWAVKLLCAHTDIVERRFLAAGGIKHSYQCPHCKSYVLSKEIL